MEGVNHEYLNLFLSSAVITNNKCLWYLNGKQYSTNQRGDKCLVSLADIQIDFAIDSNVFVNYGNGGYNQICSKQNQQKGAYLGTSIVSSGAKDNYYQFLNAQPIKYLTNARPEVVELLFFDEECNPVDMTGITDGVICLRYDYLPDKQTLREYFSTFYSTI